MKIFWIAAVLTSLVSGCCPCSKRTASPAAVRIAGCDLAAPWQIRFADGSANVTTFSQDADGKDSGVMKVSYEPMSARASSSGEYDGGQPFSGTVPDAVKPRLFDGIRRLADDPQLRVERREMGTGHFTITAAGGQKCSFMIARGEPLEAFVAFLKTEVVPSR
ncbi:hypothetical protein KKD52_06600 [Myxococcota bacterium]|nr:hypothetical protein [Myxococcota bacterium]MBU1413260.1 hypothetical protein [Myxococcota bacterium]MBU1510013.1 hypothetical protein [Myxococcota bacterium]